MHFSKNSPKPSVLTLENVYFSYHSMQGELKTMENISFSLYKGEFLAIVGPSGCGKSTLLNLISNLSKPSSGKISFPNLSDDEKPNIGYMLQHDHLLEWRTIWENVILGLEIQNKKTELNLERVNLLMENYGLADFIDKHPSELSGGMKQRAALIRTLALNPDLLLLDEPFSALDYQTRLMVSADIGKIIRQTGKTAILVTHNLSEAISMADRIIVLSNRPATIRKEFHIQLTIPDDSLLGYRNAPEFQTYFNDIWEVLVDESRIK